jgi:hypothetical protein
MPTPRGREDCVAARSLRRLRIASAAFLTVIRVPASHSTTATSPHENSRRNHRTLRGRHLCDKPVRFSRRPARAESFDNGEARRRAAHLAHGTERFVSSTRSSTIDFEAVDPARRRQPNARYVSVRARVCFVFAHWQTHADIAHGAVSTPGCSTCQFAGQRGEPAVRVHPAAHAA